MFESGFNVVATLCAVWFKSSMSFCRKKVGTNPKNMRESTRICHFLTFPED